MTTVSLIAVFLIYSIVREIVWHNERKDLYSRLMAKDLTEYRDIKNDVPPPKAPQSKFVKVVKKQNTPKKGGD